jgi:hypothetical protein
MTGFEKMILAAGALFGIFKLLTLPRRNRIAYSLFWPGLDPRPFEGSAAPSNPEALGLSATGRMILGIALILAPIEGALGRSIAASMGALFLVHMGLFDLLAAAWRGAGFPVGRICPEPWASASLSEFWGRRWNMAFHAFAKEWIYRPMSRRFGKGAGIAAVFAASGLFHEAVISFPAGGGWGLPTLYFGLHGALVWLERRGTLKPNRLVTWVAVLLPFTTLFHARFLENVIFPMVMP